MGLTIHFSLSLPANVPEEDVLNALNLIRSDAQRLLKAHFPNGMVGRLFRMDKDEVLVAQADMNSEPFGFSVQSTRPIEARGAEPQVGMGFVIRLTDDWWLPTVRLTRCGWSVLRRRIDGVVKKR